MTLMVDVAVESRRIPLSRSRVERIVRAVLRAERVRDAELSIAFVSNRAIARLNREHLGHRGATDVISFGLTHGAGAQLAADIYVAPDVAREQARRLGVPVREELARLVVHGVLHAVGYSHPEGYSDDRTASPMWRRQEKLLARMLAGDMERPVGGGAGDA